MTRITEIVHKDPNDGFWRVVGVLPIVSMCIQATIHHLVTDPRSAIPTRYIESSFCLCLFLLTVMFVGDLRELGDTLREQKEAEWWVRLANLFQYFCLLLLGISVVGFFLSPIFIPKNIDTYAYTLMSAMSITRNCINLVKRDHYGMISFIQLIVLIAIIVLGYALDEDAMTHVPSKEVAFAVAISSFMGSAIAFLFNKPVHKARHWYSYPTLTVFLSVVLVLLAFSVPIHSWFLEVMKAIENNRVRRSS